MSHVPEDANEGCVGPQSEAAGKAASCAGCPNQSNCASGAARLPTPVHEEVQARLESVKHVILVLSGKGGVGKSTVSSQLAWALQDRNFQVGVLDIDICGPSMPRMLGVEGQQVRRSNFGWSPVQSTDNLAVMSVGFMLPNKSDAVVWRGPRKDALLKQFLTEVYWGDLDFLIVDAPPGTSDEHISITEYLKTTPIDGAIIVTTPQEVALLDVRKEITFCRKTNTKVLGVVENMSCFICSCCKTEHIIYPSTTGGGRGLSEEMKVPFLGSIPLDPKMVQSCEAGVSYMSTYPTGTAVPAFTAFVDQVLLCIPNRESSAKSNQMEDSLMSTA
jgi:Mrp family chromosome partitioning ATPase